MNCFKALYELISTFRTTLKAANATTKGKAGLGRRGYLSYFNCCRCFVPILYMNCFQAFYEVKITY